MIPKPYRKNDGKFKREQALWYFKGIYFVPYIILKISNKFLVIYLVIT